ncbi:class I SAM-dependent methyltransferase [Asanoa sp. WMMD1127]|uniref:class I SAM-dependent methyltransferase n=1 Tax=Asanoa sp. WMMD1127 TaxID=3016107 RepID=UPI002417470A|nr:class I SAM-dependent methyltransferase [Asanoa sp. WMMD1127]MDG4823764.1 class I SAM-dependent methyltransferase [Asanoa sp. WMMD1127]
MTDIKRRKLIGEMEGPMARWYAKQRGSDAQLVLWRQQAAELAEDLPSGAAVLEVAPGPGYLSIELARLGFAVTGLDISRTFVQLATDRARAEGVQVEFRHGDVADLPFADDSFDLVVCQAAFKNFASPVTALDQIHRVLRPGGVAVVLDMNRGATDDDIRADVAGMRLNRVNSAFTRMALGGLRRRAYTAADFARVAADSAFGDSAAHADGMTLEVRLTKAA